MHSAQENELLYLILELRNPLESVTFVTRRLKKGKSLKECNVDQNFDSIVIL